MNRDIKTCLRPYGFSLLFSREALGRSPEPLMSWPHIFSQLMLEFDSFFMRDPRTWRHTAGVWEVNMCCDLFPSGRVCFHSHLQSPESHEGWILYGGRCWFREREPGWLRPVVILADVAARAPTLWMMLFSSVGSSRRKRVSFKAEKRSITLTEADSIKMIA